MTKQLKGRFLLKSLELVKVKGKDERIRVYNVADKSEMRAMNEIIKECIDHA